jgi:ferredoxin
MDLNSEKLPENVVGPVYVDNQCIYCGLCDEIAPSVFRKVAGDYYAVVYHQPSTPEELIACADAIESCPYECIGDDGGYYGAPA